MNIVEVYEIPIEVFIDINDVNRENLPFIMHIKL